MLKRGARAALGIEGETESLMPQELQERRDTMRQKLEEVGLRIRIK
ncbi:MAG: hypothetical protein NTZ61_20485 [Proteobacteria bacterium]|nr:hypothetical protein [Pseudomonadota bacterium]